MHQGHLRRHPGRLAVGLAVAVALLDGTMVWPTAVDAAETGLASTPVRVLPAPRPRMLGADGGEPSVTAPIMPPVWAPAVGAAGPAVVRAVQQHLMRRGFEPGPPDGRLGARTRTAIRAVQRQCGMTADGQISETLIARLVGDDPCASAGP